MLDKIIVRGAREHNLKNVDVQIPRNKLVVITGLSGSGKSTLAFDTIYAEGQRRYVESLSAYARQFLGIMNKPDVDSIEGLSPAISIEQKTTSKNPRSTVGTVTEIYDYLRLLFARVGVIYCPQCSSAIKPVSAENIVSLILAEPGYTVTILAPILRGIKGTHEKIISEAGKDGFVRVRIDGKIHRIEEAGGLRLGRYEKHWIDLVIDRLEVNNDNRQRLTEAVELALKKGQGTVIVLGGTSEQLQKDKNRQEDTREIARGAQENTYSSFGACPNHPEITFEQLEPRMFSFNSPFGACSGCVGIGEQMEISPDLIIPDQSKSIMDGAIAIYGKMDLKWRTQQIAIVGRKYGFDVFTPIKHFTEKQRKVLLYGSDEPIKGKWSNGASMSLGKGWEGLIPQTMRLYRQTGSEYRKEEIEKLMSSKPCPTCHGARLKENILSVKIKGKSIIDACNLSIEKALDFFSDVGSALTDKEKVIAKEVLKEIRERLGFLKNVGLGYLTLSRAARTLSGGEAQRIRLASQIGANLMGVLYVLDEPSIGLHQRDNGKLIATLHRLRDLGNTLIVVEHDEDTMRSADHIIDMGPGAGIQGGHICAQGSPQDIAGNNKSLTGQYLAGRMQIEILQARRQASEWMILEGASENNLKNMTVHLPLQVLCGITGVSGSGKSTLMNQTVMPALQKEMGYALGKIGQYRKLDIPRSVKDVIIIDQDPIGRTPRSNPATYTKMFDDIRSLFASTKEARTRGYGPGRFSFNVTGGRCESCRGDGLIKIEMNFLPDVFVMCEDCKGKRYNNETLSVRYKERSIAEVLEMSVDEAKTLFSNHRSVSRKLEMLSEVGLGYIRLGQSSTTLSGGESQRIKLTRELAKFKKSGTVYLLDEPTTGLHFEDVRKLIGVLNKLVEKGNTAYVIEHNMEVIKCCDYIIDLGPEGGDAGGEVLCKGTPEAVAQSRVSHTGRFLRKALEGQNKYGTNATKIP